jgi:hypothetical protein
LEDIVADTFRHSIEKNAACARSGRPDECLPIRNEEEFREALKFMDLNVYDYSQSGFDPNYDIISTPQEVIYKTWHQYDMLRYGYLMLQDLQIMHSIKSIEEDSSSAKLFYESKFLHHRLDEYFQTQCPALYHQFSQAITEREAKEINTCSYVPGPWPNHEFQSEIEWSHCANSNEVCQCLGDIVRYGEITKEVGSLSKEGVLCNAEVFGSHNASNGCECGVVKDIDFIVEKVFEHHDFYNYPRNYKNMIQVVKEGMQDVWTEVEQRVVNSWTAYEGEAALFKFQHLQMQKLLKELSSNDTFGYLAMANAVKTSHVTYDDQLWHIPEQYDFPKQCSQLYAKFEDMIMARMEWRYLAREGQTTYCYGSIRVRYGSPSADKWNTAKNVSSMGERNPQAVPCNNKTFGDPLPYVTKECHCGVPKSALTPSVVKNLDVHV